MPSAIELIVNSNYLRSLLEAEEGETLTLEELSTKLDALGPLADFADIATALTALAETSALYNRITDIKNILYNELGQPLWAISDRIAPRQFNFASEKNGLSLDDNSAAGVEFTDQSSAAGIAQRSSNNNLTATACELFFYTRILETPYKAGDYIAINFARSSNSGFAYTAKIRVLDLASELFSSEIVVASGDNDPHTLLLVADGSAKAVQINFEFAYSQPAETASTFTISQAVFSVT